MNSEGVMSGVGLTTVGRPVRYRNRETTAVYALLDNAALRDAAPCARWPSSPAPWDTGQGRRHCRKIRTEPELGDESLG